MHITKNQLARHYAAHRLLLREYFPRAERVVIDEYIDALRSYECFATPSALNRIMAAHGLITASVPTIQLERR